MKVFSTVIIAATLVSFSAIAAGPHGMQTPEQACQYIKDNECYGSTACNKQKRKFRECVKQKAQEQAEKKAMGKKGPKAPPQPQ
ncbi:hypothetical protein ACFL12_03515 [Pseudomonadota bacterium]